MAHDGHFPSSEQWADKLMETEPAAMKVATKWTGNPETARDIFHDVVARLFVKGPFTPDVSLEAVVVQSVKNRCRDLHRWEERHPSTSMTLDDGSMRDFEGVHPDALAVVLQQETRESIDHALGELSQRKRLVLIFRYHEDMTFEQIAGELELPLSTVHYTHKQALAELAKILKKGGVHVGQHAETRSQTRR